MQEHKNDIGRGVDILRKNKREMLEIKKNTRERRNAFDGITSILDTAEERIFAPGDMTIETSKSKEKKHRRKNPARESLYHL